MKDLQFIMALLMWVLIVCTVVGLIVWTVMPKRKPKPHVCFQCGAAMERKAPHCGVCGYDYPAVPKR